MKSRLTPVIAAIAVFAALTSCQKNADIQSKENASREIVFGLKGIAASTETRSYSENTSTQVQANGFNVAAITGTTTMFNEKATYASSKYSPVNGPYYFPTTGTVNFYACYPVSQAVTVTSGAATLVYSANVDTDLLAAKSVNVSATSDAIPLTFDHILSLIKFKAVGSDAKALYKVKKIKVTSPSGGTYTYSSDSWGTPLANADYVYSETTTTLSGTTSIAGAITIVPCTPSIYVEWDTYSLDGNTLVASYSDTKSLGEAVSPKNESTITITLPNNDAVGISFSVTVNAWGTESHSLAF